MTARSSLNSRSNCCDVAGIIHALVETAGELGRDGLERNAFVGERGQDHEEFRRRLRAVGFIHRNFRDEIGRPFGFGNVPVNPARLLRGQQILPGDALDFAARCFHRAVKVRNDDLSGQFRMAAGKCRDARRIGRLADGVSHVNGEEIASVG